MNHWIHWITDWMKKFFESIFICRTHPYHTHPPHTQHLIQVHPQSYTNWIVFRFSGLDSTRHCRCCIAVVLLCVFTSSLHYTTISNKKGCFTDEVRGGKEKATVVWSLFQSHPYACLSSKRKTLSRWQFFLRTSSSTFDLCRFVCVFKYIYYNYYYIHNKFANAENLCTFCWLNLQRATPIRALIRLRRIFSFMKLPFLLLHPLSGHLILLLLLPLLFILFHFLFVRLYAI